MSSKLTTPLSILAFFYILIISLILVIIGLGFVVAHDINHYLKNREDFVAVKHCKRYYEEGNFGLYERCYQQTVAYLEAQNHKDTENTIK